MPLRAVLGSVGRVWLRRNHGKHRLRNLRIDFANSAFPGRMLDADLRCDVQRTYSVDTPTCIELGQSGLGLQCQFASGNIYIYIHTHILEVVSFLSVSVWFSGHLTHDDWLFQLLPNMDAKRGPTNNPVPPHAHAGLHRHPKPGEPAISYPGNTGPRSNGRVWARALKPCPNRT